MNCSYDPVAVNCILTPLQLTAKLQFKLFAVISSIMKQYVVLVEEDSTKLVSEVD